MENNRTRQKEKEGRRSQERRKKEENHRDREEEQSKRNFRDDQGKIQDYQLHQCYDSLPAPSHKCKAAGNHQSAPPHRPHCWGEEKGLLPSEGIKISENDVMVEKKVWMEKSTDNVIKVCRLQGDGVKRHFEEEKKGSQWGDVSGATRREQEEGERPSSSSASQERNSEHGRNEWMKEEKKKRSCTWDEWEKHKKSKKGRDGKEY